MIAKMWVKSVSLKCTVNIRQRIVVVEVITVGGLVVYVTWLNGSTDQSALCHKR